jgi:hypothetical protein
MALPPLETGGVQAVVINVTGVLSLDSVVSVGDAAAFEVEGA